MHHPIYLWLNVKSFFIIWTQHWYRQKGNGTLRDSLCQEIQQVQEKINLLILNVTCNITTQCLFSATQHIIIANKIDLAVFSHKSLTT